MTANEPFLDCTPLTLLLFVVSGLLVLPTVTCQQCNVVPHPTDPRIEIQSSPSFNRSPVGALLNLTCIASQNDDDRLPKVVLGYSRPVYIQWFDPQNKPIKDGKCNAGLSETTVICSLLIGHPTSGKVGTYSCQAKSEHYCSLKRIKINVTDFYQRPKIVNVPLNRSSNIGSNVTFNCSATGYPKPVFTWRKDNDSLFIQSNARVMILTDDDKNLSQLVITGVAREDYGKYQCIANNSAGVVKSQDIFLSPGSLDFYQRPQIVNVPLNQSSDIGSNVTFNCSATGYPKPVITWTKDNDSLFIHSNARITIVTDYDKNLSQLAITGVAREDYGKYQCIANNSAGVVKSQEVFLYPGFTASNPSRSLELTKATKSNHKIIIAIAVSSAILMVVVICALSCYLWYRRTRRTGDTEILSTSINCTDSVEQISLPSIITPYDSNNMPLQDDIQCACDVTDGPVSSIPVQAGDLHFPDVQIDSEENPLLEELRVNIPTENQMQASQMFTLTGVQDTPPKRPPKPTRKYNTDQKFVCSCTLQSPSRNPKIKKSDTLKSKDSGYDSAEDQDALLDTERKNGYSLQNEEGCEVDSERLEVFRDEVLGQGEFGIVYKGKYRQKDGNIINVAVKQLKDNTSVANKADLLSEIQILKQAGRHPNIVNLVGACTQEEHILVVTELMPRGSLENLLKSKGERDKYKNVNCELNDRELLNIALQIASGMQHLEERKCIHRDLAARNIFIDDNNQAKVGDFGLARDISNDGIYTKTSNGKVPWRWSSLESLRDGVYTSHSDVWSFGIVLWEITTYGEEPYHNITTPAALINFLSFGKRMNRPVHCSRKVYTLMSSCWKENPLARPTFSSITEQLHNYLQKEYKTPYANIHDDGICVEMDAL